MNKIEYVKLFYPNNTIVSIEGDGDVITQIIRQLDGQSIGFEVGKRFDVSNGWNIEALRELLEGGK